MDINALADTTEVIKKKRGRKKKTDLVDEDKPIIDIPTEPPIPKKRGRKPKGGKLITKPIEVNEDNAHLSNIILHLKCCLQDIDIQQNDSADMIGNPMSYKPIAPPDIMTYDDTNHTFSNYNTDANKQDTNYAYSAPSDNKLASQQVCTKCRDSIDDIQTNIPNESQQLNLKDINYKLKEIKLQLYKDSNPDKKSACFWCTYEYDNPACYIPKYELDGNTCGYGSFCRPECAAAYLMKENIDDSAKFERYQLLNRIYGKVYNYQKNIRPAPNPYYLLDKFYGNLTIQEYRKLLKSEHMLLVIEKPLTRILPELHEETDDSSNSTNQYNSSSNGTGYKVKRQSEKQKGPSKNEIMKENFGF